jgi:glycosyltransferase involved in cell wall biosynthesis
MNWSGKCTVIIPCLNEALTIGQLIREVRPLLSSVLIVDDGSQDNTAAIAHGAGARVIRHERTQGKGAALATGFQAALNSGSTWALAMDGDGQHLPADIPAFLTCAESGNAGMIVGNRMNDAQAMPRLRRLVNRWMSRRLSHLSGRHLPDSQCGFRLIRLDTWAALPIHSRHFEIESELLLQFARAGQRIDFVPISVIYRNERSKIHPVKDSIRWLRWWWGSRRAASNQRIKSAGATVCAPVA